MKMPVYAKPEDAGSVFKTKLARPTCSIVTVKDLGRSAELHEVYTQAVVIWLSPPPMSGRIFCTVK